MRHRLPVGLFDRHAVCLHDGPAPDWALISLRPFDTEEVLTITMTNGDVLVMYDFSGNGGGGYWRNSSGTWAPSSNNDRLRYMSDVLGIADWASGIYYPGLVSRTLGSDGYPTAERTSSHLSLKNIFEPAANAPSNFKRDTYVENANHLFLQSVYDSTGYYYYSCFYNFATLPAGSSDFKVYEQVGTPNLTAGDFFYQRGNFMPFNDLDPTKSRDNLYQGGQQEQLLDDTNPRKNEDLYGLKGNTRDYFFGMIMEAKFEQGPEGMSEYGDPMVFEFNGDDDMWVYVDDVLLLDIGGIHDAFHGKINFATGRITVDSQSTTSTVPYHDGSYSVSTLRVKDGQAITYIKEQYWQAQRFPDGTPWTDISDAKANDFFTNGGVDEYGQLIGTYKDYSTHDMKMFYMERGAGASNLQIRFNMPVVKNDSFRVKKQLNQTATGEDIQSKYSDTAFYYKAFVKKPGNSSQYTQCTYQDYKDTAVYDDGTPVVWQSDGNGGFTDLFIVKPGQTAIFPVQNSQYSYYVQEVEPVPDAPVLMLDKFKVSNSDEDPRDSTLTKEITVKKRGIVIFDNMPIDDLVGELRITKNLHGDYYTDESTASHLVEATETKSPYFEYRVFLESTGGTMVPFSLGEYYLIDAEGNYVYYDSSDGGVRKTAEVTGEGSDLRYVYTYNDSSRNETLSKPKITEHTSQNGTIGDIRDGDTVIIKGLMEGTDFIVDERTDRSHMRGPDGSATGGSQSEVTLEDPWENKYYFSDTDVENAYIRADGTNAPDNLDHSGMLYDEPDSESANAISGTSGGLRIGTEPARGTILAKRNAKVTIHNEVYNDFSLPLRKEWPTSDFSMSDLGENAQVEFQLKRYKLSDKGAGLTVSANVSGRPDGYDPIYTIASVDSVYSVRYSEMEAGEGTERHTTLTLPIGTYTITRGADPDGYDATHNQSAETVSVTSNNEAESGAVASPASVTITSRYTQQTGSLRVTKNLTGYSGGFGKFKATYALTDAAGSPVKDASGDTVQSVEVTASDFTGSSTKTWTHTFDNLPSGTYYVREIVDSSTYDNTQYTIVHTVAPENRAGPLSMGLRPRSSSSLPIRRWRKTAFPS